MHCEATSEKQSMGYFCDGRASLVVGTHTHVPTADHRILPGGTAFMSDVGMTGDYQSVIGMDKDEPLSRFLRSISSSKFEPANGPATLCGAGGRNRRRDRACHAGRPGAARRHPGTGQADVLGLRQFGWSRVARSRHSDFARRWRARRQGSTRGFVARSSAIAR